MLRSGHSLILRATKTHVHALPRLLTSRASTSASSASSPGTIARSRRSTTTLSKKVVTKRRMASSDGGFLNHALDEDGSEITRNETVVNPNSKITFRPSRRASRTENKRTHPSYFCPACNAQCKATVFRRHTQKCCPDIESAVGKEAWMTEDMDLIMVKARKHANEMLEEMKRLAFTDGARMSHAEVAQTLNVTELRV